MMSEKSLETLISQLAEKVDAKAAALGGWENVPGAQIEVRKTKGGLWDPVVGEPYSDIRVKGLEEWLHAALEGVSAYQVKVKLKGPDGTFARTAQSLWHVEENAAIQKFEERLGMTAADLTRQNVAFAIDTSRSALGALQGWMERALTAEARLEAIELISKQGEQTDRFVTLLDRGEKLLHAVNAGRLALGEAVERVAADPSAAVDLLIARNSLGRLFSKLTVEQLQLVLAKVLDELGAKAGQAEQVDDDDKPSEVVEGELFSPLVDTPS